MTHPMMTVCTRGLLLAVALSLPSCACAPPTDRLPTAPIPARPAHGAHVSLFRELMAESARQSTAKRVDRAASVLAEWRGEERED